MPWRHAATTLRHARRRPRGIRSHHLLLLSICVRLASRDITAIYSSNGAPGIGCLAARASRSARRRPLPTSPRHARRHQAAEPRDDRVGSSRSERRALGTHPRAAGMRPSIPLELFAERILELAPRFGVSDIRLFGSAARGSDTANSDVDLLVDADASVDFLTLAAFRQEVSDLLGFPVDAVIDDDADPVVRSIRARCGAAVTDETPRAGFTARPRTDAGRSVYPTEKLLAEITRLRARFARAARDGRDAFVRSDSDSYDIGVLAVIHLADLVNRQLPDGVAATLPPVARDGLRATRNIAAHNYAGLDNARLWDTVTAHAPHCWTRSSQPSNEPDESMSESPTPWRSVGGPSRRSPRTRRGSGARCRPAGRGRCANSPTAGRR